MKRLLIAPLLVASVLLALGATAACGNDGDNDGSGSPQDYLGQVTPSLDRTLDVTDEWNRLQDEIFQIDATRVSLGEAESLVEEQLAAARKAKIVLSDALTVMQSITAPDECLEIHLGIIESMQLAERGFGDIASGLTSTLRGGSGADALERGSSLLAESDRVKASALPAFENCG